MSKKIKTEWNLGLLYKGNTDPKIENDIRLTEDLYSEFEKKFKGQPFFATPESLAEALAEYESLIAKLSKQKPAWYFDLKTDLNSSDDESQALSTKYSQRLTEAGNKIKFFMLEVAKIPASDRKKFLEYPALAPYRYLLSDVFKRSQYDLTEGEEQLQSLLNQTSYEMWRDSLQKLLNEQVVKFKGKNVPINKALAELADMPKKDRRTMSIKIAEVLKAVSPTAENEINAIFNYKKIMDKRRGFAKPYSATILGYENDEKAIINFVALVTKYFHISHRFYKLHAKLHGEKKITMADRSAKVGNIKTKFDFTKSVAMLQQVLAVVDKEYLDIFNSYLEKGQIDVYPKKGKKGGAYCWGRGELPIFVMLNHVDDVRSLETLAHEMGHAIHGELSRRQPYLYRGHTTSTAEVASTFFEQIVSNEIEKQISEKEKISFLHNRLMGDISTIFRQIACFNFENELHEKIRKEGRVSKENIAVLMQTHLKSYTGDAVNVTIDDGYFYVSWPHIRRFFYVYSYAYGQLISRALFEKWKENPKYGEKVKQFLSAGCSDSPENIFKAIGIDTSTNDFFEAGLKSIEKDIIRLEEMAKNFKPKK